MQTNPGRRFKKTIMAVAAAAVMSGSSATWACGGFFCQFVPIDQAGEQIVFRQDGAETTAMIKIEYAGNAEDFGWVLPVPEIPEISLGSDQIFTDLEAITRPQFTLTRTGDPCFVETAFSSSSFAVSSFSSAPSGPSVVVEKTLSVGPFDAQVISSDDATALAAWLAENNLDLTDQGDQLLAPYVAAKSKFVVLKLKNFSNVGSIQPIILKYNANAPVIPMTLTAVAAQNDMGVLVWLLGDGRGVPKNYKHVIPNYTRLNWYNGTRAAYRSYQQLITAAMDDAGGQGFATDFAGYMPSLADRLSSTDNWLELKSFSQLMTPSEFVTESWFTGQPALMDVIQAVLPTSSAFVYQNPQTLDQTFTVQELQQTAELLVQAIDEQLIKPLENARDILDDNLYMTRLYTTLSADEMSLNPEFTFNTQMPDQPLERKATLAASCNNDQTEWTLHLGEGTGRNDELVVQAWANIPSSGVAGQQKAMWRAEKTQANADPVLLAENTFETFTIGEAPVVEQEPEDKKSGGALNGIGLLGFLSLLVFRRKRRWAGN